MCEWFINHFCYLCSLFCDLLDFFLILFFSALINLQLFQICELCISQLKRLPRHNWSFLSLAGTLAVLLSCSCKKQSHVAAVQLTMNPKQPSKNEHLRKEADCADFKDIISNKMKQTNETRHFGSSPPPDSLPLRNSWTGVGGASVWLRGPYQGQHVSLTSLRGISSKTETFKLDWSLKCSLTWTTSASTFLTIYMTE